MGMGFTDITRSWMLSEEGWRMLGFGIGGAVILSGSEQTIR